MSILHEIPVVTIVLLGVTVMLTAFGLACTFAARALRNTPKAHWQRTTGWWGPWRPGGSQWVHYVVDGVEHHVLDMSTVRWPKRGPIDVLFDPLRPSASIIDVGGTPGATAQVLGIFFFVLAGLSLVLSVGIPIGVELVLASLRR